MTRKKKKVMRNIGIRHVVGSCVMAFFSLVLLLYTAMANLRLLQAVYPDQQTVALGLFTLEGGSLLWLIVYFVTRSRGHKGICVVGVAGDILLSCTGFVYELATNTHTALEIQTNIIYIMAAAVVFNLGASLCYKMIPAEEGDHLVAPIRQQEMLPKNEPATAILSQTSGPGLIPRVAASVGDVATQTKELMAEKAERRRSRKTVTASVTPGETVTESEGNESHSFR